MNRLPRNQVMVGDARFILPTLPEQSVSCVITSPPYFNLRRYDMSDQIGLESHVDAWVDELRVVLRGLARVLHPSGSLWLNLGDSYARSRAVGATTKSLLLAPERVALAMIEDGWIIRSKVIWHKTNAMPSSARDRLSCAYEVLYLAVRSPNYFFDLDSIRIPPRSQMHGPSAAAARRLEDQAVPTWAGPLAGNNRGLDGLKARGLSSHPIGKNPGDVWDYATSNFRGAHHATFPEALLTRPLLASCPERVCTSCNEPWRCERDRRRDHLAVPGELRPACTCNARWRSGLVLDPFMGAGTVGLAAERYGRDWLGIELNPRFAALAEQRIAAARREPGPKDQAQAAA
jgi:site-specific DNA-methyltransferase (adenine-specific)